MAHTNTSNNIKSFGDQMDTHLFSHQTGLMVAVAKGFIDIVTMLHSCPYVHINHQDNDGNTALMIAAQAGTSEHISQFSML